MSKIFLPLRSNAAWFVGQKARYELEKKIKNYIILYDEIFIQNARYICTIGEEGSFDLILNPEAYPGDRTSIRYFEPGKEFAVMQGDIPVVRGKSKVSYEVDYYPILHDASLLDADYFKWNVFDITDKDKETALKIANGDLGNNELINILPTENYYQQKAILESIYIDSLLAYRLSMPFLSDYHIAPIIKWKNAETKMTWQPSHRDIFFKVWATLGLPDYGEATWEDVHNIRESSAGKDFRKMISRITNRISDALKDISDKRDLKDLINKEFVNEIIKELLSRRETPKKAVLNLALNLIPYNMVISTPKDIYDVILEKKSWISLLEV